MYTIRERVGASKTDGSGRLKITAAIDMMQDCSIGWMAVEPTFSEYLKENGLGMFITFRQADFLRMPAYGEELTVTTTIYGCRGYLGYRNTAIYDARGEFCAISWSVGAFVDIEKNHAARLPDAVSASITMSPKLDMEYLSKRIPFAEDAAENLAPIPVRRNDIDFNGHVNNARYIETALEYLPEDFAVSRLRVEYKRAARYGDVFYPARADSVVKLNDAQGEPYAVMEFSR